MKKVVSFVKHIKKSIVISWVSSPIMFLFRIINEFYLVVASVITSYFIKNIINILSYQSNESRWGKILYLILFLVCIQVFSFIVNKINNYMNETHNEKIAMYIKLEIIKKINSLDISYFDNPKFYDEIQNATRDSKSFQTLTWIVIAIIRGIVQMVFCGILLGNLAFYIPLILIAVNVPSVLVDKYVTKKKYKWQIDQTINERKYGYFESILRNRSHSKDIRVYHVDKYLTQNFISLWKKWFSEKSKINRQKYIYSFLGGILPIFCDIGVLVYVCICILNGSLTLGDFTYYRSMASQFRNGMNSLLMSINSGYESEMKLSHYEDFLNFENHIVNDGTLELKDIWRIEFKNVCFKYPHTESFVLSDINFTIDKHEKIALVGANGSGKSTLVKLLLRLYDTTSGEILINSENIKKYTLESLHNCFSIVFQDFNRYNFSLKDAITISDIGRKDKTNEIYTACENANIDINGSFKNGIDTFLGKIFDKNGVELSGGQWQKIAIAQAYFKKSNFVIMDEPNSSLDPASEDKMFKNLQKLTNEKGGLIITHRLSSVFIADRIVVLENGMVEEIGTHDVLMQQDKLYKKMFNLQAEKYRVEKQ